MKNITRILSSFVLAIVLVLSISVNAFAATDPEGYYMSKDRGLTVGKMFTSGELNGPESTGVLTADTATNTWHLWSPTTDDQRYVCRDIWWTLKDGVAIVYGTMPATTEAHKDPYYGFSCPFWPDQSPLADNPYIETAIFVNLNYAGVSLANCSNLKTVLLINTYQDMTNREGDPDQYISLRCKIVPKTAKYVIAGLDRQCGEMVSFDPTHRANGNETYAWGYLPNSTTDARWMPDPTCYQIYSNEQTFIAYVNGVLAETKLNDEARALLASYGYDVSGASAPVTVEPPCSKPDDSTNITLTVGDDGVSIGNNDATVSGRKVSNWASASVDTAAELGIGTQFADSDCTVAITRAQFCELAMQTYCYLTGEPLFVQGLLGDDPFTDTSCEQEMAIVRAYQLGIVNGYGNGLFGPNDLITREQAAVMLSRLAEAIGKPMTAAETPFTDGVAAWAANGVALCYGAGIMKGTSGTTFSGKSNYTIEQSLVTMVRTVEYAGQ